MGGCSGGYKNFATQPYWYGGALKIGQFWGYFELLGADLAQLSYVTTKPKYPSHIPQYPLPPHAPKVPLGHLPQTPRTPRTARVGPRNFYYSKWQKWPKTMSQGMFCNILRWSKAKNVLPQALRPSVKNLNLAEGVLGPREKVRFAKFDKLIIASPPRR